MQRREAIPQRQAKREMIGPVAVLTFTGGLPLLARFFELVFMPTYEYQCEKCDHEFEVFQSIKADPLTDCPKGKCKGKVRRLIGTGAGIIFKGSGFYETDYRSESYKAGAKKDTDSKKSSTKKDSKSKSDSKPKASKVKKKN
jgi:putative FmdB family regulatory protein